jgi:hypothetical protein
MTRILAITALLAVAMNLAGCTWGTKYETWPVVDNNCSGNRWLHDDSFCADYLAHMPPPPRPQS